MYNARNPKQVGVICMIFADKYHDGYGGRYFHGTIVKATKEVIRVKVDRSTWADWQEGKEYDFLPEQIWAYREKPNYTQLSMF